MAWGAVDSSESPFSQKLTSPTVRVLPVSWPTAPNGKYLPVNMRFSGAFATLLAAATAVSAANIPVTVGANGTLTFSPTNVTAAVGDVIVFTL